MQVSCQHALAVGSTSYTLNYVDPRTSSANTLLRVFTKISYRREPIFRRCLEHRQKCMYPARPKSLFSSG